MSCVTKASIMWQVAGLCGLSLLACSSGGSGDTSGQTAASESADGQSTPSMAATGASGSGSSATSNPTANGSSGAGAASSTMTTAASAGSSAGATNSMTSMGGDVKDSSAAAGGGAPGMAEAGAGAAGMPAQEPACDVVIPSSTTCGDKLAPGDHRTCMIGNREYIIHVGKTWNPCEPVGLVIDAHGASERAIEQFGTEEFCASGNICWHGIGSGWAAEADSPNGGFIAIFPQGNNNMWSASDASFMLDIVEEMKKQADIDPKKIYMSGISNGGFLTFQTGCAHADVFKGMAPVAGGTTCSSVNEPIPLISFDAEPDFAYDSHKSANESVVRANNCKSGPKPWLTIDSNYTEPVCRSAKQDTMAQLVPCNEVTSQMIKPTVCQIWEECDGGVKVVWCDVSPNEEHGASNAALDAHILYENDSLLNMPSVAWRFFQSFW